jgi:hypothetical protein
MGDAIAMIRLLYGFARPISNAQLSAGSRVTNHHRVQDELQAATAGSAGD